MSTPPMSPTSPVAQRRFSPLVCAVWVVIGAVCSFALVATFTPFLVLMVPAVVVGLMLIRRRGLTLEILGVVGGLALVLAYVAALS